MFNQTLADSQKPTVLISGASGANGSELAKIFSSRGVPVRAMVRDKSRAGEILLPGVEIVEGDFDAPATISAALQGIERAFLLSPSSENAEKQQVGFVEAAKSSGVKHIVKLSQVGASSVSSQRFLRYHGVVEDTIRASGLSFTFLQPNLFMQGLLNFASTIQSQNAFYAPAGEGKISVVDVRDIARVGFTALTQTGHDGKSYRITGPQSLTHAEMAAQLSESVGRNIRFVDVPPAAMRDSLLKIGFPSWQADGLLEEYAAWSQSEAAEITSDVRDATGQEAGTFEQFARDFASAFG